MFKKFKPDVPHEKTEILSKEDLSSNLEKFHRNFEKSNRTQTEISLTLSEIREQLEQNQVSNPLENEINKLIQLNIDIADMIEAFYQYGKTSDNDAFCEQSRMMWLSLLKKFAAVGLTRIPDEQTKADHHLNEIVSIDATVEKGTVSSTVSSGYTYKGNLIRKSKVIVGNKEV